jgi:hypothetical protein
MGKVNTVNCSENRGYFQAKVDQVLTKRALGFSSSERREALPRPGEKWRSSPPGPPEILRVMRGDDHEKNKSNE